MQVPCPVWSIFRIGRPITTTNINAVNEARLGDVAKSGVVWRESGRLFWIAPICIEASTHPAFCWAVCKCRSTAGYQHQQASALSLTIILCQGCPPRRGPVAEMMSDHDICACASFSFLLRPHAIYFVRVSR